MKPEELDRLIHRYFEGDLSPEEEGLLWSVIRIDRTAADRFVELSELESAMIESLQAEEAAPPEVRSTRRDSRRMSRVMAAVPVRRPVWPLFFAAVFLMGFLALLIQSADKPRPVEVVRRSELPKPAPAVAPLPAAPEPVPPKKAAPAPLEVPAPAPRAPEPVPVPKPVEPPPSEPRPAEKQSEPPAAPEKTVVAEAPGEMKIQKVEGDVVDDAGAVVKAGQAIVSGHGLEIRKGWAILTLKDETQIELRADTRLDKVLLSADQKKFQLARGIAIASVARQQPKTPVVFVTPHAEVTVLGTKLQLEIGKERTQVDVQEGRVRCKRLPDGALIEIPAGKFAIAAKGLALALRPIPIVRIFQDGVAPTPDYHGTADTMISSLEPGANFGKVEQLQIERLGGQQSALIRWDLSSIPPGSRVVSAELTFWVTGKLVGDCKIHALNLPFEEYEATYRTARGTLMWRTPGAQSDLDRGKAIALLAPEKPGFATATITDPGIVQNWINNPRENFGILIAGPDANIWGLEARETALPDRRPKLTITTISAK